MISTPAVSGKKPQNKGCSQMSRLFKGCTRGWSPIVRRADPFFISAKPSLPLK